MSRTGNGKKIPYARSGLHYNSIDAFIVAHCPPSLLVDLGHPELVESVQANNAGELLLPDEQVPVPFVPPAGLDLSVAVVVGNPFAAGATPVAAASAARAAAAAANRRADHLCQLRRRVWAGAHAGDLQRHRAEQVGLAEERSLPRTYILMDRGSMFIVPCGCGIVGLEAAKCEGLFMVKANTCVGIL